MYRVARLLLVEVGLAPPEAGDDDSQERTRRADRNNQAERQHGDSEHLVHASSPGQSIGCAGKKLSRPN